MKQGTDKGFPEPMFQGYSEPRCVSEVICNQFTKDAYLPCIVCTVWVYSLSNKAQLEIFLNIYELSPRDVIRTSVVSTVPLLIGREENMGNELFSRSRRC